MPTAERGCLHPRESTTRDDECYARRPARRLRPDGPALEPDNLKLPPLVLCALVPPPSSSLARLRLPTTRTNERLIPKRLAPARPPPLEHAIDVQTKLAVLASPEREEGLARRAPEWGREDGRGGRGRVGVVGVAEGRFEGLDGGAEAEVGGGEGARAPEETGEGGEGRRGAKRDRVSQSLMVANGDMHSHAPPTQTGRPSKCSDAPTHQLPSPNHLVAPLCSRAPSLSASLTYAPQTSPAPVRTTRTKPPSRVARPRARDEKSVVSEMPCWSSE